MEFLSRKPSGLSSTRDNRRGDHVNRLLTCALCVLLALPGLAAAKKPPKNSTSNNTTSGSTSTTTNTDSGCAVFLPAYVDTGAMFSVKVVKVPSYPGTWSQPTFYVDADYTTTDGSTLMRSATQTINRFDVSYGLISIGAPSTTDTNIASSPEYSSLNPTVTVTVMVSEMLSKGKANLSTCSATTPVMLGN